MLLWTGCPSQHRKPRLSEKLYWLGQDYYAKAVKTKDPGQRERFLDEAFVQLKRATAADERNIQAWSLLGYVYLYRGDRELGLVEVSQCLEGADGAAIRGRADELFHLAGRAFSRVVRRNKGCTSAQLGLISVDMHFERYESAVKRAKNVVEMLTAGRANPKCSSPGDKAVALGNMGWALAKLGRRGEAERVLREALVLAPKFYLARYWLGRILYEAGRYAQAAMELGRTVRDFGLPQAAWAYYGLVMSRLGRKAEAARAFDKCIGFAPQSCMARDCRRYNRLLGGAATAGSGG